MKLVSNNKEEQLLETQNKKNSTIVQKVLIVALFIIIIIGAIFILSKIKKVNQPNEINNNGLKTYESNIILDDPETLQDEYDKMVEKAKEGRMALEMKTVASSDDGKNFICYLGNAKSNSYDMYMVLYLDSTQEEIYRTGLLPVGSRIESFELEKALEPGEHTATIVYNQVEDDGVTVHAQVNVGLDLVVEGK